MKSAVPRIPLCALVVGHSMADGGAVSRSGKICEYAFNDALASDIAALANPARCAVTVMHRMHGYSALPREINAAKPDFAIELHANASNGKGTGTEVLYWHTSPKGKIFAGILHGRLLAALGLKDRGIKPIADDDRGGFLLKRVAAPALIAEPFFIDNEDDLRAAIGKRKALVAAYAKAIELIAGLVGTTAIK